MTLHRLLLTSLPTANVKHTVVRRYYSLWINVTDDATNRELVFPAGLFYNLLKAISLPGKGGHLSIRCARFVQSDRTLTHSSDVQSCIGGFPSYLKSCDVSTTTWSSCPSKWRPCVVWLAPLLESFQNPKNTAP